MGISPDLEVYSVKEAADILKTSRQQIRRMIQNEELCAVKVGREWRIPSEHLREWIHDAIL
jgi:excisionase family DNA binding protein